MAGASGTATWSRRRSATSIDDRYRLWFVDHAMHTGADPMPGMVMPDTSPARRTRMVSYLGVLQQALRDVAAWVEHGVAPPSSTAYELVDGQVLVPATAAARRGVQPVVDLTVDGGASGRGRRWAHRSAFTAVVEVPPGAGAIVAAEWDFEGTGDYPLAEEGLDGSAGRADAVGDAHLHRAGHVLPGRAGQHSGGRRRHAARPGPEPRPGARGRRALDL